MRQSSDIVKLVGGLLGMFWIVFGLTMVHPGLGLAAFGYMIFDLATG